MVTMGSKEIENNNANRYTKRLLHVCDFFVAIFVVAPLVVIHWYGTWTFMDQKPEYFPNVESIIVGILWHLLASATRNDVYERLQSQTMPNTWLHRIVRQFIVKIYLYLFSVTSIMQWRAMFNLMMEYFGNWMKRILSETRFNCSFAFRKRDSYVSDTRCAGVHNIDSIEMRSKHSCAAVCHHERHERSRLHISYSFQSRRKYFKCHLCLYSDVLFITKALYNNANNKIRLP